jgi:anti-sigma factor ChrR (cupin superfamily)
MATRRRKAETTSLEELFGQWKSHAGWAEAGVRVARMTVGDPDDPASPVVFHSYYPPGWTVAPHTHACDYLEIILEGSQQVTGRWHQAGDVRMARAGTVYGPLVAGPEGVTFVAVFRDHRTSMVPPAEAAAILAELAAQG